MIYPTLHLTPTSTSICYLDTQFDENPFLITEFPSVEDGVGALITMLTAFVTQYWQGYDTALSDMTDEEYDDDYGDIV